MKKPSAFEQSASASPQGPENYVLRLYVTGMSPRSTAAIAALKQVCEEHLAGHYDLEVIDLYRDPARAQEAQIVASPTLVRQEPLPERRMVGDLSDQARVLTGLSGKAHR